jgi:hypothetical protein
MADQQAPQVPKPEGEQKRGFGRGGDRGDRKGGDRKPRGPGDKRKE